MKWNKAGQPAMMGLAVCLILSGCGSKSGEKAPESKVRDPQSYIRQSCAFKNDEGDLVREVSTGNPVIAGYFSKSYNKDWLASVAHTSIIDTATYIEKTGTKVYYSNAATTQSCKNLDFLRSLPSDLSKIWSELEKSAGDDALIAGLYLVKDSREARTSLQDSAAVIVRSDSSRWTLVHEFMHHNFMTQSIARGYNDADAKVNFQRLINEYNTIGGSTTTDVRTKLQSLTRTFLELSRAADQQLLQYPLEEVAIEATLQDRYDAGDLTYVSPENYANATWYIKYSKENAAKMYLELDSLYDQLRGVSDALGMTSEYNALAEYSTTKNRRLNEISNIVAERQRRSGSSGNFMMSRRESEPAEPLVGEAPCAAAAAHDKEILEAIQSLRGFRL